MRVTERWIKVNTEFRGVHNWPECPYDDVAFLRNPHRHVFKVEVRVRVKHHDREIEFFRFQRDIDRALNSIFYQDSKEIEPIELGRKSCEEIAEDLGRELLKTYSGRHMVITVSEDGEVAAEIRVEDEDVA